MNKEQCEYESVFQLGIQELKMLENVFDNEFGKETLEELEETPFSSLDLPKLIKNSFGYGTAQY